MSDKKIGGFFGEYSYLSNFYPAPFICDDGIQWDTSEHYYQAHKFKDEEFREKIRKSDLKNIKRLAKSKQCVLEWDEIKQDVMKKALRYKFTQNKDLKKKILATDSTYLEETNNWKDYYWGVCCGLGDNFLGKFLMELREELTWTKNILHVKHDIILDWYDRPVMMLLNTNNGLYVSVILEDMREDYRESWVIARLPKEDVEDLLSSKIDVNKYFREEKLLEVLFNMGSKDSHIIDKIRPWKNEGEMPFNWDIDGEGYIVNPWIGYGGLIGEDKSIYAETKVEEITKRLLE